MPITILNFILNIKLITIHGSGIFLEIINVRPYTECKIKIQNKPVQREERESRVYRKYKEPGVFVPIHSQFARQCSPSVNFGNDRVQQQLSDLLRGSLCSPLANKANLKQTYWTLSAKRASSVLLRRFVITLERK